MFALLIVVSILSVLSSIVSVATLAHAGYLLANQHEDADARVVMHNIQLDKLSKLENSIEQSLEVCTTLDAAYRVIEQHNAEWSDANPNPEQGIIRLLNDLHPKSEERIATLIGAFVNELSSEVEEKL